MDIAVHRVKRSDPDAPLLVMFHDDGENAAAGVRIGRRLWPGAPLVSVGGGYAQGSARRHLSQSARVPTDMDREADAIARMAEAVRVATQKEPKLVEVVGVGVGGGADAVLTLLCRRPTLFAAAVLCRPRRRWCYGLSSQISSGNGVEVFIVTDVANTEASLTAQKILSLSGHNASIGVAARSEEIDISRFWICRELRGDVEYGD